jgi:acetyl/propionyl-CoA carboxylase alpha subunit
MANLTAAESISTRHTLLVANRGEIAVRIIRTAKRMGIRTIGVYTPADAISPHVTLADLAIALPNPPPPDSIDLSDSNLATKVKASTTTMTTEGTAYLIPEPFIEICKKHDVTLLHPGYGFLSENAEFAEMVINAGVVWLGPKPNVIRNMGLKHEARKIVKDVAVADGSDGELVVGRSELALKVVPGSEGLVKDAEEAKEVVRGIGLPVLFKASAGGGGLGMIVCEMIEDVEGAFENATRRAEV